MVDSPAYEPLFELARGGMGRIVVAVRLEGTFKRVCAMKRLFPHLAEEPGVRAMFLEEARIAAAVRHPNVVSVLDVGEDSEGPYLVMDYIESVTAAQLIRQTAAEMSEIPLQICARICADAARGLHAVHEITDDEGNSMDLVHRDISPQNLLVGFDGVTRVADFGVAKAVDSDHRTRTGLLKGKMGYMAPERLRFEHADRRADLFALGVVLYELLGGERLYQGADEVGVARRILDEPAPDIGLVRDDVPPSIVQLLFQLLAKRPEKRPDTAAEVAQRLDEASLALALSEGPVDLAGFVEDLFGTYKSEQARKLQVALAEVGSGRRSKALDDAQPDADEPRRPPRRAGRALAAAAVVTLGGLVVWGVGSERDETKGTADVADVAAAASMPVTPALPVATADLPERPEPDAATNVPQSPVKEVAPASATSNAASRRPAQRKPPRRVNKSSDPPAPSAKIRTWEW